MESEVGTPIEYNPEEFVNKKNNNNDFIDDENEQYYDQPPPHVQQPIYVHQPQIPLPHEKNDIFSSLDKTGYIIIFVAFLLGFFMGKTMQPVILRPG